MGFVVTTHTAYVSYQGYDDGILVVDCQEAERYFLYASALGRNEITYNFQPDMIPWNVANALRQALPQLRSLSEDHLSDDEFVKVLLSTPLQFPSPIYYQSSQLNLLHGMQVAWRSGFILNAQPMTYAEAKSLYEMTR